MKIAMRALGRCIARAQLGMNQNNTWRALKMRVNSYQFHSLLLPAFLLLTPNLSCTCCWLWWIVNFCCGNARNKVDWGSGKPMESQNPCVLCLIFRWGAFWRYHFLNCCCLCDELVIQEGNGERPEVEKGLPQLIMCLLSPSFHKELVWPHSIARGLLLPTVMHFWILASQL